MEINSRIGYQSSSIFPKKPNNFQLPVIERIGNHLNGLSAVEKAKANILLEQKTSNRFDIRG